MRFWYQNDPFNTENQLVILTYTYSTFKSLIPPKIGMAYLHFLEPEGLLDQLKSILQSQSVLLQFAQCHKGPSEPYLTLQDIILDNIPGQYI